MDVPCLCSHQSPEVPNRPASGFVKLYAHAFMGEGLSIQLLKPGPQGEGCGDSLGGSKYQIFMQQVVRSKERGAPASIPALSFPSSRLNTFLQGHEKGPSVPDGTTEQLSG